MSCIIKDSNTAEYPAANVTSCVFTTKQSSDEDFNCNERVRPMGFASEPSTTAWLYELKRNLERDNGPRADDKPTLPPTSSLNYFQDHSEIPSLETVRHLDQCVQPPRKELTNSSVTSSSIFTFELFTQNFLSLGR